VGIENLGDSPGVSWAQVRIGFPGVFGFGTALDAGIEEFGLETIRNLLKTHICSGNGQRRQRWFWAKSELGIGRRYAALAGRSNSTTSTRVPTNRVERTAHPGIEAARPVAR
jgi:phosphoenolpyruvate carboxylase